MFVYSLGFGGYCPVYFIFNNLRRKLNLKAEALSRISPQNASNTDVRDFWTTHDIRKMLSDVNIKEYISKEFKNLKDSFWLTAKKYNC